MVRLVAGDEWLGIGGREGIPLAGMQGVSSKPAGYGGKGMKGGGMKGERGYG